MAAVKAGTAYVTVELAGVAPLKKGISDSVTTAATAAGEKASTALGKSISGTPAAQKIVKDFATGLSGIGVSMVAPLAKGLVSAVRSGAVTSAKEFTVGFSKGVGALLSSDTSLSQFLSSMKLLGSRTGLEFVSSFGRGIKALPGVFGEMLSGVGSSVGRIVSSVGSALATIPGAVATVGSAMSGVSRQLGIAAQQAQYMGFTMLAAFTAPVAAVGILGAAIGIKFAVQVEDATVGLKALLPAGYNVEALIKRLQALAIKSPVFDTAGVITFTQRMVAAGLEIGKVERFLAAFGNIAVTVGIPMNKMNLALEAFAQMAGKGTVNMEELRQQLGDSLPGALKIAAEGLGITQKKLFELVEQGKIDADQLLGAFIKVGESKTYVEGAAQGADTLRSRWNQMVESVQTRLGQSVLDNMDQVKSALASSGPAVEKFLTSFANLLPGAIKGIGNLAESLNRLITKYDNLSDKNKDLVKNILVVLVTAGPLLLIISAIGTAIAGVAGGLGIIASPLGMVVIGVGLAIVALKFLWEWLKNLWESSKGFRDTVSQLADVFTKSLVPAFKEAYATMKDSLSKAWEQIKRTFQDTGSFDAIIGFLKVIGLIIIGLIGIIASFVAAFISAIGYLVQAIVSLISGIIQIVAGIFNLIQDLFAGNFDQLVGDLRQIWDGLWDAIWGTVVNVVMAIATLIWEFIKNVINFFTNMYDVLVGHSIIPDMMNAIFAWFAALPGRIIGIVSGFVSDVINFFKWLWDGSVQMVAGLIGDVVSYMSSLPGRILSAIGNLSSLLYNVGKDIISGLINGISSMAGSLLDKARNMAGQVADAFSGALKIGSPSKVMAELGRFVVQGIIVGIGSEISNMISAIGSAFDGSVQLAYAGAATALEIYPQAEGIKRQASLNIENYHAAPEDDPATQAEKWAFLNNTRGW
ncbi:MAG TPA: tape measure protein [Methylomicrobium sp.]|nr:tape measure protein [Methylomicrobium sp.]